MRARYKACILSLLLPLALQGQDVGLLRLNPATGATGKAGVYGGYEAGGYHPAFAPASLWKAGASAQGTRHGESTSFTGSFSFEQIDGKEQFTSMFLEPGYFPVDVLEFTPGDKTRQTFKLGGGFATEFTEEFVFGVKANYTTANYAKRKDIRHTTYGMDLQVEPTFAVIGDNGVGISAAYVFRKRTETIDAEQVGAATDQSYFAFLDKGMRYGTYQVWDGDGIHLDEAGVGVFPVKEYTHGFSYVVQMPVLSGGMSLLWKHGFVGEKGYDWFRYPGFSWTVFMEGRFKGRQSLRLDLNLQTDQLKESVLDKVSAGGVTTPTVYAWNAVSDRLQRHGDPRRRLRLRPCRRERTGQRRRRRLEGQGTERRHGRGRIRSVPPDPRLVAENGVLFHDQSRCRAHADLPREGRPRSFPPDGRHLAPRFRHRHSPGGRPLEHDRQNRI